MSSDSFPPPKALERGNNPVDKSQLYFSDSKWWTSFGDLLRVSKVIFIEEYGFFFSFLSITVYLRYDSKEIIWVLKIK